jgi:hypothetical protein
MGARQRGYVCIGNDPPRTELVYKAGFPSPLGIDAASLFFFPLWYKADEGSGDEDC